MKEASRRLNINYYSAKTVLETYKKKGRICKKLTRDRKRPHLPGYIPTDARVNLAGAIDPDIMHSASPSPMFRTERLAALIPAFPMVPEKAGTFPSGEATTISELVTIMPEFSFKSYSREIADVYMRHHEEQLFRAQKIAARTLPVPGPSQA